MDLLTGGALLHVLDHGGALLLYPVGDRYLVLERGLHRERELPASAGLAERLVFFRHREG